ncbi:MAG: 4-hydroxy-tetrahydrodipicolinate synthase [Caldicoprobacter oshimai]|uniref:4-hydroxy-tetrahydrodipicolinate synthase n=1 Tax=Caldicoprobacter faecalis TaxID=937334 RepID=A0A1I5WX29_9FIRM|nr:4-hydroxy-tetrahydrodipicolinate synthase [Caldicoprobacter faecalis]PZN11778.1 MAG: 4-hydroxy-tetrahydrodipicolinate synthase [Caldicoprobacter oshimai]SFQ24335.1 dihydrodipicolinate synthase [Caldicoprobacter faecalis]
MSVFTGSCVALVTPFTDEGVNFESLANLIEFQIREGTDAILVCGTTGEPPTMTRDEKYSVIGFTVEKVAKRVPVIAGTGGYNTATVIEDSKEAERLGADALLIVTPYYNKTTQKGLIQHYAAIADAVHIPIIIYNVPGRTGLNVAPSTLKELSKIDNIVGIKEASGNIAQVTEMARLCGDKIDIYSGDDNIVVPILALGGKGVISVVANIAPRDTHEMVAKFLNGDIEGSRKLQFKLNPLIEALFLEVNPIPVKTALNLMGMNAGKLRMPLTDMSEQNLEILKKRMVEYGLTIQQ